MDNLDNRRTDRRLRTLKGGRIVYNGGFMAVDCMVKNISEGGALLETDQAYVVPSDFVLHINPERDGRPCHVAWREGNRLGVTFTGPLIVQEQADRPKRSVRRRDEGY